MNTTGCIVLIASGKAAISGPRMNDQEMLRRALSLEGIDRVEDSAGEYNDLVDDLEQRFGCPKIYEGATFFATQTVAQLFAERTFALAYDENIVKAPLVSMARLPKKLGLGHAISEAFDKPHMFTPEKNLDHERAILMLKKFILSHSSGLHIVPMTEALASFVVLASGHRVRVGLHACQAYLIFMEHGRISLIERFEPKATLAVPKHVVAEAA